MVRRSWVLATITAAVMSLTAAKGQADSPFAFQLTDVTGTPFEVAAQADPQLTVVCFLGTECPMARLYGPRLSAMARDFADQQVRFVGVNSNHQDSMADIRKYIKSCGVTFPVVRDVGNQVADQYQAERTPEVFVLDHQLNLVYQGRIDDQYAPGVNRGKPQRRDLHQALSEWLSGKPVTVASTDAPGCKIGRVRTNQEHVDNGITYAEHVAPMLNRHCVECHRQGEIGPFAMDDYDEVYGWADTMLETIDDGRMPPWHADPAHGDFQNARFMPEEDKQLLRDWIAGGLPAGDLSKVPPLPEAVTGWQLSREPDLVLEMRDRPFTVPEDGTVEYQYFVVDPGFTEDKWISDAQTLPGNRAVVHHIIVFIRPPELSGFRGVGWLTAYVPGAKQINLPKGRARLIPAGSKLVFQMHYTPNGEAQDDLSRLGLVFADREDVTHEVYTLAGLNQEFEIPPGEADHVVDGEVRRLPNDAELLGIAPHMHYRGKSFRLWDGPREEAATLLHVPSYDFNWQHVYQLKQPLPLNDVRQLNFQVSFDNSSGNPFNPDPRKWVTWGDQSWEEMAVAFFDVAVPRTSSGHRSTTLEENSDKRTPQQKIDAYVAKFLKKLDVDGDGLVSKDETPLIVRRGNFHRFDGNGDGQVTRDEITAFARDKFSLDHDDEF